MMIADSMRHYPTGRFDMRFQAAAAIFAIILMLVPGVNTSVCAATAAVARHHLQVELFPEKRMMQAVDEITIEK